MSVESTAGRLPVRGTLPEEFDGIFSRIGPNPVRPPRRPSVRDYQWFRQDGLVSGVRLRGGRAEWFRSRWIRSRAVSRALGEPPPPGPRHFPVDTTNTNVVAHAGRVLALVETGCAPVLLDADLSTDRFTDLGGQLRHGLSAHPKIDPVTGELHAFVAAPLAPAAQQVVIDADGRARVVRTLSVPGRPLVHDIGLTASSLVFFDLPVRFGILRAARGRFPYRWHDDHRSRIGVLPRSAEGQVRWFDISACFVFHIVDAVETERTLVVRAVRYRRLFDSGHADPFTHGGQLWRWTIDLRTGAVAETALDDRLEELPRVAPAAIGAPEGARFAYAVTAGADRMARHLPDALLRHDLHLGRTDVRPAPPGTVPSEVVFVPRDAGPAPDPPVGAGAGSGPGGGGQEDGWLLYFSWSTDSDTSALVVLDARDFTGDPVAVVDLPVRVPFGFHSTWVPAEHLGGG